MNFQAYRATYKPVLPKVFNSLSAINTTRAKQPYKQAIKELFPKLTQNCQSFNFQTSEKILSPSKALKIGCVLSGGQAPGGHNVIAGIYDCIKTISTDSQLFGFLNGPHGIFSGNYKQLTRQIIDKYRNRGGFDMICSGRHKIQTAAQFQSSLNICQQLQLDGLVVIGGDDSNTNAGLLAQYFLKNGSKTKVIGCPKTIDGDLKNQYVEVSFGFDTACKTYSESIGNIMFDALSSKKYYHFVRLMGRSASHIALQCALSTRPNLVLIGQQIQKKKTTLKQIVCQLSELIKKRQQKGKLYGVILVPQGLIQFISEVKILISQINKILAGLNSQPQQTLFQRVAENLTFDSNKLFQSLPISIANQLLLDRDPHGNVQVAKIQTQRLLVQMLQQQFKQKKICKQFSPQTHYFGYQGRCAFPSIFDCDYCYGLGFNAGVLITQGGTGLMSCIRNLQKQSINWQACGYPLVSMMNIQVRKGKNTPVITKALVKLDGQLFNYYQSLKDDWKIQDRYCSPGPVQFQGNYHHRPYLAVPPKNIYLQQDKIQDKTFAQLSTKYNHTLLSRERSNQKLQIKNMENHFVVQGDVLNFKSGLIQAACQQRFNNICKKSTRVLDLQYQFNKKQQPQTIPQRIGLCFNTRQLPGCHSIIQGLFQSGSQIFGFLGGTAGLFSNKSIKITSENINIFRNLGGMHMLGRDKDRVRNQDQLIATKKTIEALQLDGLILVGATHTLTDALILSEYLLKNGIKIPVVGIPCSIDQSVCHPLLQLNLGFTTNSHFTATMVANLLTDASSNTKYWYFIRLMCKQMSFIVMEVALKTMPNMVLIGQQIFNKKAMGINQVVKQIADVVQNRAKLGYNYGSVLLSDGLLAWIMQFIRIFREIDDIRKEDLSMKQSVLVQKMTPWTKQHYTGLPQFTRQQLLLKRQTNGSPQYNKIETQRLFAYLVDLQLTQRKKKGSYKGSFAPVCHYFGYQGRSSMPCDFDIKLGKSYGVLASKIIKAGHTAYCTSIRGLLSEPNRWHMSAIPLLNMLDIKQHSSYGYGQLVIRPSQIKLNSRSFNYLISTRQKWKLNDNYTNPGPIQFNGPFSDIRSQILVLEYSKQFQIFKEIQVQMTQIRAICKSVGDQGLLQIALSNLHSLAETLKMIRNRLQQ